MERTKTKRTKKKIQPMLVAVVLDESGSMETVRPSIISGYNEYIGDLKTQALKSKGSIRLGLTKFASDAHVSFEPKNVVEVENLTMSSYRPDGMTALYDAVAKTVRSVERSVDADEEPPKVLVVIMTDGYENASKEHRGELGRKAIQALVSHKEGEGNWTFVYMGANQDAWMAGTALGIQGGNTLSYQSTDTHKSMRGLSERSRGLYVGEQAQSLSFFSGASSEPAQASSPSATQELSWLNMVHPPVVFAADHSPEEANA